MKEILEKRIQELDAQAKAKGEEFTAAQTQVNTLANDYNVFVIKLEEAKALLASVVKAETEAQNAICEPGAEATNVCETSQAS